MTNESKARRAGETLWAGSMTPAWTFPCNPDKTPIPARGFKDAFQGMEWRKAPLVGAPTGAKNGFSVLDVDPNGFGWYAEKFGAIPETRRHETQRGVHLLFRHAPGLRGSIERVAPGVDIRAEGNYVIWWPREGLAVDDWPLADWPDWLLEEAKAPRKRKDEGKGDGRSNVYPSTLISPDRRGGEVASLTEALRKLDPVCWNGRYDRYDDWLALMMACKFAGIEREEFIEWSCGDPDYANDGEVIARKWESFAQPKHAGALFAALKEAGIKVAKAHTHHHHGRIDKSAGVHMSAALAPARPGNLVSRSRGLIDWLRHNATGDGLFSAACLFAEIGLTQDAATKLVDGNLPALRRALGEAEFNRQIAHAFAHVANKLKEPQS
jgi:Primase C terminal 2 (PriCT-2)/Bifunctional DNA primase/polymerase, N-terminal